MGAGPEVGLADADLAHGVRLSAGTRVEDRCL